MTMKTKTKLLTIMAFFLALMSPLASFALTKAKNITVLFQSPTNKNVYLGHMASEKGNLKSFHFPETLTHNNTNKLRIYYK